MTVAGFVPKPRTTEVVCNLIAPQDGADPLTATVRADLTFAEIDELIALRNNPEATYAEIFDAIARSVLAWNALAFDNASGDYQPVPPPAEVGPDALRAVDKMVTLWLLWELSGVHLGGEEREKKDPPPADTPRPSAGESSTSPTPIGKKNRRPRTGSGASLPTT